MLLCYAFGKAQRILHGVDPGIGPIVVHGAVEPLNAVRRLDWSWLWGYIDDQILQSGDVWVGITMPGSSAAIKKFNPTRYTAVSFANTESNAPWTNGISSTAAPSERSVATSLSCWRFARTGHAAPTRMCGLIAHATR